MIRHVVLISFVATATTEQREAVLKGLARLPDAIDDIRSFAFGADARLVEGNADIAVVADFEDASAYLRYAAHPAHRAFLAERVGPVLASRVAVQYDLANKESDPT